MEICYRSPRKPSVGGENGQLHPLHGRRRLSDRQVEGSGCRPGAQKESLQTGTDGKDCGWDVGRSLELSEWMGEPGSRRELRKRALSGEGRAWEEMQAGWLKRRKGNPPAGAERF